MKVRVFFSCLLIIVLHSCGVKKKVSHKKNKGTVISEEKPPKLPSVNETAFTKKLAKNNARLNPQTLAYIRRYAPIAVQEMHDYKIPASITLAQGILESGRGRSELALKSNNHFGIKCHTTWQGERVYHDDDEKGECFRKYTYPETSYKDHSLFLTQRSRYAFLFKYDITDYKSWAYGLRKAGYATDKKYPSKLLKIIRDYKLYTFDNQAKKNFTTPKNNKNRKQQIEKKYAPTKSTLKYHIVQKGETLYALSKKYNISVTDLMKFNNLLDTTISIGQKLIIKHQ